MKKYLLGVTSFCLLVALSAFAQDKPAPEKPSPEELQAQAVIQIGQLQVQLGQMALENLKLKKELFVLKASPVGADPKK